MPDAFQYDVFLSYIAQDKAVVRPLAERLRKDGLKVWFDEWVIKPGNSIPAKIGEGLEHSEFGFRISDFGFAQPSMSANAFGSDWAQLRLPPPQPSTLNPQPSGDPLNKERRFIVPLRLDDAPSKAPWRKELAFAQTFDTIHPMNWREHILSDPQILRGKPCVMTVRGES